MSDPENCDHIFSIPDESGIRECLWCGTKTYEDDDGPPALMRAAIKV